MFKLSYFSTTAEDNSNKDKGPAIESDTDALQAEQNSDSSSSIRDTYSRLGKRSKLLQRLRKSSSEKAPSPDADKDRSYADSSDSLGLPPLSPVELSGYNASTKNRLMDQELADNIRNLLPARYQLFDDWHLEYSLEQHGISLKTLYRNCNPEYQRQLKKKKQEVGFADNVVTSFVTHGVNSQYLNRRNHGYILVVRDETQTKFGCFLNENLKPMEHKRYYGNGECFMWKNELYDPRKLSHYPQGEKEKMSEEDKRSRPQSRFKAFMYTGINDNILYLNQDFIAVGSSDGKNGLWLDKTLYKGVSCPCETFGNEVLNGKSDGKLGRFKVMGLEV